MKKMSFDHIKQQHPDEWILLANPEFKDSEILSGSLLFHHPDKRTVLAVARQEFEKHPMIKVAFTGEPSRVLRLNIYRVFETT
ncbi:MAG: hypothetical protein AAB316_23095 [Bacteroidota bacterium]